MNGFFEFISYQEVPVATWGLHGCSTHTRGMVTIAVRFSVSPPLPYGIILYHYLNDKRLFSNPRVHLGKFISAIEK